MNCVKCGQHDYTMYATTDGLVCCDCWDKEGRNEKTDWEEIQEWIESELKR